MKIGIISDTHNRLSNTIFDIFEGVEAIIHAGDIGDIDIVTSLETIAPVYAVSGNTDGTDICRKYPEWRLDRFKDLSFFTTHIFTTHPDAESVKKMLQRTSTDSSPDVFIFGHTHRSFIDNIDGTLVINPGSFSEPRYQPQPGVAFVEIDETSGIKAWKHEVQVNY